MYQALVSTDSIPISSLAGFEILLLRSSFRKVQYEYIAKASAVASIVHANHIHALLASVRYALELKNGMLRIAYCVVKRTASIRNETTKTKNFDECRGDDHYLK